MKLKSIIAHTCILFTLANSIAQELQCGTIITDDDLLQLSQARIAQVLTVGATSEIKHFAVQHHIVRKSDGTGGLSPSVIPQIMDELNEQFAAANIQFCNCYAIDYIDSDTLYDFTSHQESLVRSTYDNPNAMNVYYFNSVEERGDRVAGYTHSPGPGWNFIMIDKHYAANGSTVIHEFGHAFGLLHTHHVSGLGSGEKELVERTNCDTAGDRFCDTPADPNLLQDIDGDGQKEYLVDNENDCNYTGTQYDIKDLNGDFYQPNTRNFMSYSRSKCQDEFSPEQINKMNEVASGDDHAALRVDSPIKWENTVNALDLCNGSYKSGGGNSWNAGTSSVNTIPAHQNGWIQIIPTTTANYRMIGLSELDQGATWNTIEHNLYLYGNTIFVYESGSYKGSFGIYAQGNTLRIEVEPFYSYESGDPIPYTRVSYLKNGQEFYYSNVQGFKSFVADLCLYTAGSSIQNISMSHGQTYIEPGLPILSWTNDYNVDIDENNINKNSSSSWWNAGAFAQSAGDNTIWAGSEGWISVNGGSMDEHRMIGMSPVDQGATWNTIKYNLYFCAYNGGEIRIYSYGSWLHTITDIDWDWDDKFRIEKIRLYDEYDYPHYYIVFKHKSNVLYGWEISYSDWNEDLLVDMCLYTPNSWFQDIKIVDYFSEESMQGLMLSESSDLSTRQYDAASPSKLSQEISSSFAISSDMDTVSFEEFDLKYNQFKKIDRQVKVDPKILQPDLGDSTWNNPLNVSF